MTVAFETVTLVIQYDEEAEGRPENWDWWSLIGNRTLVLAAHTTELHEEELFEDVYGVSED